ncbi:MAG: OmpA family protein [Bacteroidales bacterium]
MKNSIFFLGLISLSYLQVNAQDKFGPYETNRFRDNWFVGVNGGVQTMFGGHNDHGSFGKRLGPVFDLNAGKWITPNVGVRASFALGKMKGFGIADTRWTYGVADADGFMRKKYNYFTAEMDVLYNISNAWWGYREDRVYNCIPFVGMMLARSEKGGATGTSPGFSGGILNQFNINSAWAINLEVKAGLLSSDIDRATVHGGRCVVVPMNLSLGFTYRFKKRNFKRVEKPNYSVYDQRIATLENDLSAAQARAKRMEQELDAEKARKAQVVQQAACDVPEQAVFFRINSSKLTKAEKMNLKLYADAIKQNKGEQYKLIGYADLQTGSKAFNEKLALKRAEAVMQVLVNDYGVDSGQLTAVCGNLENPPFAADNSIYNRAVILNK